MAPPADNMDAVVLYHERRKAIRERVKAMGHGTQFKITLALAISPSLVSSVLSGKYMDPDTLDKIEGWVKGQEDDRADHRP